MKNKTLIKITRAILKELLSQCSEPQQLLFKRMYNHKNLEASIDEAVDQMEPEKMDWAVTQVEETIKKFKPLTELNWIVKCELKYVHYDFMKFPDFPEPPEDNPSEQDSDKWFMYEQKLLEFFRKHNIEVTDHIAGQFGIRIK